MTNLPAATTVGRVCNKCLVGFVTNPEGGRSAHLLALSEGQRVGAPTLRGPPAATLLAQRGPSEWRRLGGLLAQGSTLRTAHPSDQQESGANPGAGV